jgi:hypothetical protein
VLSLTPSTATKAALLDMIFEECGRAGYEFDRSPGEDASALRRVDAMMAEWQAEGMALAYNFPAVFGTGQPTDVLGIPDSAINTVAAWAAFRIAPGMGKTISSETRKAMADGKAFLRAETSTIPCAQLPRNTARGSGQYPRAIWWPFEVESDDSIITLPDLVLSDASALASAGYAALLLGAPQGASLTLINNVGGKYVLYGNEIIGAGLVAGTDAPIVRQTLPGATNSPHDTTLAIVVT